MSKPPAPFSLRLPAERRTPRGAAPPPAAGGPAWGESLPDGAFQGLMARRCVAFAIDLVVIALLWIVFGGMAVILGVLSLGLLWGPATALLAILPVLYSALTIGAPALQGSPGMRLMRLRAASWRSGEPPGLLRGAIMSVLFYATVPFTFGVVLAFGWFNTRKRLLHDALSDVVVYNDDDVQGPAA
ncbi:MAG: RDD family protein [Pseudomonadota bacterium]